MNKTSAVVSGAVAVGLLSLSGVAHAITVPGFTGTGVSSPGYPDFCGANVDATLTQNKSGSFTLSVIGNTAACGDKHTLSSCSGALFNFPGGAYFVGNESVSLTANFSASGVFTSGSYSLIGSLPASSNPTFGSAPNSASWGMQGTETLLTATLTGDAIDSSNEALGFREVITGGWADQPQFTGTNSNTTTESVWLYSLLSGSNPQSGDNMHNSAWNNFLAQLASGHGLKANTFSGIGSIATVPLPAAVLLFGSGLMGLGGLVRRRRSATA